jgi:hypothetical protein
MELTEVIEIPQGFELFVGLDAIDLRWFAR